MLGVMLLGTFGVVSAVGGVDFVPSPFPSYLSGDSYLIEWTNTASAPGLYLQYAPSPCGSSDWDDLSGPLASDELIYDWDTTDYSDGSYCLRLVLDSWLYDQESFTIDNTAPWVDIHETTPMYPGADEYNNKVKILTNYGDVNPVTCTLDWGDGHSTSCPASGSSKQHQYDDNGVYTVVVTVEDLAGNTAVDSVDVSVANVAPWCPVWITTPTDVASSQAAFFDANAIDVVADLNAGLLCTWTFDAGTVDEVVDTSTADATGTCEIYHTWTSASPHTVDLCFEDKDGGEVCLAQHILEVEDPEHMTPMQKVVANEAFEFDLDAPWAVSGNVHRFKTSISGITACDGVVLPVGMTSTPVGADKCKILWTPTNDQRGENHVIIRASNGVDYKYYSFDVTVYSWGVHLGSGWNLISIPYVPADSDIDAVFADILPNVAYVDSSTATVLMYDSTYNDNEGRWYKSRPSSGHTSFTWSSSTYKLDTVVPGYAYWIKMDNADTLYGIEENFAPGMGPVPSVELASDAWNLIGRFGSNPFNLPPATAFETLNGDWYASGFLKWDGISSWNIATTVDLGEGYWLRTKLPVSGHETMTYDPLSYYFD